MEPPHLIIHTLPAGVVMIDATSLAIVTDRMTRTLAVFESIAEVVLRIAAVQDGCPAAEVGPILDYLVRRQVLERNVGCVALTYYGRKLVERAKRWREEHEGTPIAEVTWT